MKALKILNELSFTISKYTSNEDIIEAIKELEELQDKYNTQQELLKKFMIDNFNSRSCDNCIESSDGFTIGYYESKCKTCSMNYECKWESKE